MLTFVLALGIPYGGIKNLSLIDTNFIQLVPRYKEKSTRKIEAYASYDEKFLYIKVKPFYTENERFAKTIARDGNFEGEDAIFIIIDPLCSGKYYWFGVNLLCTKQDGNGIEGGGSSKEWDAIWDCEVKQHKDYWYAIFKIPWKAINFNFENNKIRLNIVVQNYSNHETDYLFDTGADIYKPSLFGEFELLDFSKVKSKLKSKSIFTFLPYFSGYKEGYKYGIDTKIRKGKNSLCIAYNLDYVEVEPDIAQISLSPYAQEYYPEKRKFFTEGLYLIPMSVFYTRKIKTVKLGIKAYGSIQNFRYNIMGVSELEDTNNFFVGIVSSKKGNLYQSFGIVNKDFDNYCFVFTQINYNFSKEYYYSLNFSSNLIIEDTAISLIKGSKILQFFGYKKPTYWGNFCLFYDGKMSMPRYAFGYIIDYKSYGASWFNWFNVYPDILKEINGYWNLYFSIVEDTLRSFSFSTRPTFVISDYLCTYFGAVYSKDEFWEWEEISSWFGLSMGKEYGASMSIKIGKAGETSKKLEQLYSYNGKVFANLKRMRYNLGFEKSMSTYLAKPFICLYTSAKINLTNWIRLRLFGEYYEKQYKWQEELQKILSLNMLIGIEKLPFKFYLVLNGDYDFATKEWEKEFYLKLKYLFELEK